MRDPIQEFVTFNRHLAQRDASLIRFKIARMAESAFAFFRGTFHLFARDVREGLCGPAPLPVGGGTELDIVGDIHSENYGTFKADDGVVHYDVNDFDEATRGPFERDVHRLATSLFLAARELSNSLEASVRITLACATAYVETARTLLKKCKELHVSENAPSRCPPVDALIQKAASEKRAEFIARLTEAVGHGRRLRRSANYFNLPDAEREQALRLLADYRRRMPPPESADFYDPFDVCGRVAGIGSMGRFRYVVLVAGKSKKEGRNVLLEFKESLPSAYEVGSQKPASTAGRAEQVAAVTGRSQAASNPHLGFACDNGMSFQVREIGPHDAKLRAADLNSADGLECLATVQAGILARIHARSANLAVGPANPLTELRDADLFCQRVLAFALAYADLVRRDWVRFVGERARLDDVGSWSSIEP